VSNRVPAAFHPQPASVYRIRFAGQLQPLHAGEVHLWRARVADFSPQLVRLLSLLSVDERQYVHRFRNSDAREQYIVGRALLRSLLSAYTCTPAYQLKIGRAPGGKLYLASPAREVNFNLSYSTGTVVLAFARDREVGVDIEAQAPLTAAPLANRILPQSEARLIRTMPSSLARVRFSTLWSRMEACAKATGVGVTSTLGQFRRSGEQTPAWCRATGLEADPMAPHVRSFRVGGQICSVATFGTNWAVRPFQLVPERGQLQGQDAEVCCRAETDHSYEPI
jgi:4'-phosphopantetheinyl transferase